MSDLFRPTNIVTGTRRVPVRPPRTVRPPTESGPATTIDITSGVDDEEASVAAPSSVDGDRIYLWLVQNSNNDDLTADPTGFTLAREAGTGGGNNPPLNWLYYQDVTTPPATITLPPSSAASGRFAWIAWTVRGGSSFTHSSAAGQADSSTNDPPAVSPSDAPGEYIVYTMSGFNADDGSSDTKDDVGGSTGYTPLAYRGGGFTSPHAFLASANKTITTSENPDSFVYPSSPVGNWWTAVTVAVKYTPASVAEGDHTHVNEDITDDASHGELYVSSSSATTISDTSSYVDVAGTWTLGDAEKFDENTNGQLRYTGTPTINVVVSATISLTSAGNNDVVHLRLAKNGTSIAASDATQKLATGSDVANITSIVATTLETDDYITVQVRNETATNNLTAAHANIVAHRI